MLDKLYVCHSRLALILVGKADFFFLARMTNETERQSERERAHAYVRERMHANIRFSPVNIFIFHRAEPGESAACAYELGGGQV